MQKVECLQQISNSLYKKSTRKPPLQQGS